MTTKFVNTKTYSRPIKKSCVHCNRRATVVSTRKKDGFRLLVRFCQEHAEMRGAV